MIVLGCWLSIYYVKKLDKIEFLWCVFDESFYCEKIIIVMC